MVSIEQMEPQIAGYDRAITVFSPNGRLYQVEYAREAVQRGTISLGIKYANGVLLAVDKNVTDPLIIANSIEKIYEIDKHIGFATTGLLADGRRLVDKARVDCQSYRMTYGEAISLETLTKKLTDQAPTCTKQTRPAPSGSIRQPQSATAQTSSRKSCARSTAQTSQNRKQSTWP